MVRQRVIREEQSESLWLQFLTLRVDFIDFVELRRRAWEITARYRLPTLYDAAFLACSEVGTPGSSPVPFWTADGALLTQLGTDRPSYVRHLRDYAGA